MTIINITIIIVIIISICIIGAPQRRAIGDAHPDCSAGG